MAICSLDMELLAPSRISPAFFKVNIHLSVSRSHPASSQQASACYGATDFNKSWAHGIRLTWKPFPSLAQQCSEPPGPTAAFLRGACMILRMALHLYSRLPQSLVLEVVWAPLVLGGVGLGFLVPWRVSGCLNYSCRQCRTNAHTLALESRRGRKSGL